MIKKARITKLSDDKFEGNHPNGYNVGAVIEGQIYGAPVVGERFICGMIGTSTVTHIIDDSTFKTLYSTYKIEYLDWCSKVFST